MPISRVWEGDALPSKRWSLSLAVVVLVLLTVPAGPALGAELHDAITKSARVSNDVDATTPITSDQINSDLAMDEFGVIHAVWQDKRSGLYNIMYGRSDDGGCTFGPSILVNGDYDKGAFINPAIAVDRMGNPHIAWQDPRNSGTSGVDIYYARSYDRGDSFGPNVRVNSDTGVEPQTYPSLAVSPDGTVCVVYISDSGDNSDVYLSKSTDGGRTFDAMIKINDDGGTNRQLSPDVATDNEGVVHMTWTDTRSGNFDVFYAFQGTTGVISSNIIVNDDSTDTDVEMDPVIACDGNIPIITWRDKRNSGNPDIYIADRISLTKFSANRRVNTDDSSDKQVTPGIAVSAPGHIHVVWEGILSGRSDIFLANSSDGGLTFDADALVSRDPVPIDQKRPVVAASDEGGVVVAWDGPGEGTRGKDVLARFLGPSGARDELIVSDDRLKAFEATPATAVGSNGALHAVWVDNRRGLYDVYHAISSDGGNGWGDVVRVSASATDSDYLTPDVAVGPDNTAHVVWTDYRDGVPKVFYANDKGGSGFNGPVRVDDSGTGGFALHPSVTVSSNGSVMVSWLDGRTTVPKAMVTYSRDYGTTWEASLAVPGPSGSGIQTAPALAVRDGLVAVAFTDDAGGSMASYLSIGVSVGGLGDPLAVDETAPTTTPRDLCIAMDQSDGGPVHVVWLDVRDGADEVWYSSLDVELLEFSEPDDVASTSSSGPRISPVVAAGDGGAAHLAWVDLSGTDPEVMWMTIVPGLDPVAASRVPTPGNAPSTSPAMAFASNQLSLVLITDPYDDPDVACGVYENTPPPAPVPQAPANNGWVTESSFDLQVQQGGDDDDDPVLIRFVLERPDGPDQEQSFTASNRLSVTGATEGTYHWRAYSSDNYGIHASPRWSFTVDLTPPSAPEFLAEPEYTMGTNNTLTWNASTDPLGGEVFYRVVGSLDPAFPTPYLKESDWINSTNYTFEDLPTKKVYYKLEARDVAGNRVDAVSTVFSTQDTSLPRPYFSVNPALQAEEGQTITFDASSSVDDNGIALFQWDFDSDGEIDSTEDVAEYAYDKPGWFNVTLILTDYAGNWVSEEYEMEILDTTPPSITVTVDLGTAFDEDSTVTFNATGTEDPSGIKSLRWYVDDEQLPFAQGRIVTRIFPDPGTFTVTLKVSDEWDNEATHQMELTVRDKTPPEVAFNNVGPIDNTRVDFFTLYVNVTDNYDVASVYLWIKTQDGSSFDDWEMSRLPGSTVEWYKDELAPGGEGNATYYIKAYDGAGNENKTDYVKIRVVGVVNPSETPRTDDDGSPLGFLGDYWWLILILVVVVVAAGVGATMASKRKTREVVGAVPAAAAAPPTITPVPTEVEPKEAKLCAIEDVYFIHNDGRLIHAEVTTKEGEASDRDVFAGMFTAIQDFISDSMAKAGDLGSFEYGDNRIIIERGKHLTAAVTIYGTEPSNLREEIREIAKHLEGSYAGVIERWDGDKSKLQGISEYGKRVMGLTGGVDRQTILKSKEKKGVKLISEVEFFQGFVRLKAAVKNDTETVVTDAAMDIVYDDTVLRLDHIQPVYEYKRGKVYLGNVNAGEKKTVAFNFDPIICMESNIDGNLTYRDVGGNLLVVSMKTRRADIVCPIFFTRENANTAMLKRLIREELSAQDSKVYRYPDGLAPLQAFELCKGVVHLHDVKFVREFIEEKPTWLGEAWFYGETKVKGFKIVIRVMVREDSHTTEFFVASSQMEVITGLLAELGHSLNRMLKEKYMGRLKAKPIVDQRLMKDITEQPLLLERAEE